MRRTPPPLTAAGIGGLTCTLLLAACGSAGRSDAGDDTPPRYAANGTFTMAVSADPGTFDPYQNRLVLGLSALAYDSLINLRPDGEIVSGLAREWTAGPDSATFTLRPGITCSDGTPLTAGQVAAVLNHVAVPKNSTAQYGTNVPTVPYTAKGDDASRTVTVTMRSPYGFVLNTLGQVPIVCPRGMRDRGLLRSASAGTGPFVLTGVVPGQSYTFTVRKDYAWGPGGATTRASGTPAKVVLRIVPNETTAANLVLSGEVNFAKVTGPDRQRLAAGGLKKVDWRLAGAWLSFNQIDGGRPTADTRVRRALVHAVDVGQVVKVSTGGAGSAVTNLVSMEPNPCPGDTVAGLLPAHDPAAATALLDQAGWTKGADGVRVKDGRPLTIDLHFVTDFSAYEQATAEYLAQQWKALGVRVKTVTNTLATAGKVVHETHNYDVLISGYNFSLPSQLVPYLSGATPPDGDNTAGVDNEEYDSLTARAIGMTPPGACAHWKRAEQAIVRDVDLAPLSNRVDPWFLRKAQAEVQRYNAPIPTSIRVLS
jgi:peptide/nickel transport system substrate-binding protein